MASTLTGATYDIADSEQPPVPFGGYQALVKNIDYPSIAEKTRFEGTVTILAFVDESGQVTEASVLEGSYTCLDTAAVAGVKRTRFKPAMQLGRPIGVWLAIPVRFEL